MAFYRTISKYDKNSQRHIAKRLIELRESLNKHIKSGRSPDSLIVGSWNIRAFDGGRSRRDESYHYIAEIIDNFDICAIQEIKTELKSLRRLMKLLGPNWSYFVSDVTVGNAGNSERMAFLYNENKVTFRHLIGEIVLPNNTLIEGKQIARSPFFASFQAGWFKFTLCSAHITFAENSLREQEISAISKVLEKRAKKESEVYILLGDMNIESPADNTMKALTDNGFTVPLFGSTNLIGGKHFDQIAFTGEDIKTNFLRNGVFDWQDAVYKKDDADFYESIATEMRGEPYPNWDKAYRGWTSHEMSDHFPIWVELKVDYSDKYLDEHFISHTNETP